MHHSSQKIMPQWEAATQTLDRWRFFGKRIVFTNGCFDLLHLGHVDYLEKAAALGDKLVIGLNTDASVSRIKGPNRPLQNNESRSRVMAALGFVDLIFFFDQETPLELIQFVKPDILCKGADYEEHQIVGADFVKANGGKVERIELVQGHSTTNIVNKIQKS